MTNVNKWMSAAVLIASLAACGTEEDEDTTKPVVKVEPTLTSIQTNVFNKGCAVSGCHDGGGDSGLDLRSGKSYADLIDIDAVKAKDMKRVVAGKPKESFLYIKLTQPGSGQGSRMPQGAAALPSQHIEAVREWIANGAKK